MLDLEKKKSVVSSLMLCFLVSTFIPDAFASSGNWVEVTRFTGSESSQTEQFTCDHVDWRIRWDYTPRSYTVFTLITYDDTGIVVDHVHRVYEFRVSAAETSGTSNIYNMNGTFYMSINTVDVSDFTVIVEQNVDSIPEFPSIVILPFLIMGTSIFIIIQNKLSKKRNYSE